MDICLGGLALLSLVSLLWGSANQKRQQILLFLILSGSILLLYWSWFLYLKVGLKEREASEEVRKNLQQCFFFKYYSIDYLELLNLPMTSKKGSFICWFF